MLKNCLMSGDATIIMKDHMKVLEWKFPMNRYVASIKQMPSKLPLIEYSDDAILRRARGNGYIQYKSNEYLVGEAFKGSLIEIKHNEIDRSIELYFGQFKIYSYDY